MKEYLVLLDHYIWVGDIVTTLICLSFVWSDKQTNSSFIAMVLVLVTGVVSLQYERYISDLDYTGAWWLQQFVWYMGFMFMDMLYLCALYIIHRMFNIKLKPIAIIMIVTYSVQALLHLGRYFERFTWQTGYSKEFYLTGSLLLNIGSATICFVLGTCYFYKTYLGPSNNYNKLY